MSHWLRRAVALLSVLVPCVSGALSAQTIQRESFQGREVVANEILVRFRDGATTAMTPDIITAKALTPSRITLLKSGGRTVPELLREYSARPDVLYAEPNYIWRKNEIPSDPLFSTQWALRNTGQFISGLVQTGTAGADIRAVQAWDIAQGSRSIVIGIVDSGIDYNHPDLAANIWTAPRDFTVVVGGQSITCAMGTHGFNAITKTCDPADDDPDNHGTHVAGIIGADGDNGIGVSGVSRVASMMALKFLGPDGSGTTADAILAIQFAIQAKAVLGSDANIRILNNSWGSTSFSQTLLNVINDAGAGNMLFVAGAGNDSLNTDVTPHYPSGYNAANILSVAATDNRDALVDFSNFGVNTVHLGAPGRDIASTGTVMAYAFESGTSMSTAVVSGAAGLVLSGCTNLTTSQLRATLIGSVDPLPSLQSKTSSGGRVNVRQALVNCAGAAPPVFTLKSLSPFVVPGVGGSAPATISMSPLNGFASDVTLVASSSPGIGASFTSSILTPGAPSTTLNVSVDPGVAPGSYVVHVTGTGGGIERTTGLTVVVGSPISLGQNIEKTWSFQTSQPNRFATVIPPGLADWYELEINSTTTVNVSLYITSLRDNFLRLVSNTGVVIASTNSSSNNTLQISQSLTPGRYAIVTSSGTVPGLVTFSNYSLAVNAPQLRLLNPNTGEQGATVNVSLSGSQFAPDLTIDAGSDISVSNIVFNNSQSASATFSISPSATLGNRSVRVITSAGTSNGATFIVQIPSPAITSVTPPSGVVGTSVDITILGANFFNPTVTASPPVTLDNVVVVSQTTITGRITIPANVGTTTGIPIQIRTAGGFAQIVFKILPLPPTLSSITPSSGGLGTIVDVTLTGSNIQGSITQGSLTIDAGAGITVTNISLMQGFTSATARFNISPTTSVGLRNVTVTTAGGTTGAVSFMVTPGPGPTLTSITPSTGPQTTTRALDVRGTNFTTGFTLDAGPDITVGTVAIVSGTQATVSIQVGASAALGARNVTVTTLGGTSNPLVFTILPPPPTLTSITPSSGVQQSTVGTVTLVGTNFAPGMTIQGGPLSITQLSVIDSTTATAFLSIPVSTQTGNHNVTVVTPSGTSTPVTFTVLPGTPTLTGIQPAYGIRGDTPNVTLTGTNFATGSTTISPIPGVDMFITNVSGSSVGARFAIFPITSLGTYSLTVTTPGGTTAPVTFSIYDPFPDLGISSGLGGGALWRGLTGTYSIGMTNNGTAPATDPIVITDVLPPELTFISGGGNGFSCSANGQVVTCVYSISPFTRFSSTFLTISVAVSASAPASVTHTVSLPYDADFLPANNTVTSTLPIQNFPVPTFTLTPATLTAGQQATVALALTSPISQEMTGTLTLSFSSATTPPVDDPAIQFATGGRQVSFVISANTLQARFGIGPFSGSIGFQPGTVAGSISFSGIARVGGIEQPFSSPAGSTSLSIAPTPPVIQSVRTSTQGGFAVLITSSSTPRSVTELSLQFNTTPAVQINCGSVSGCTASGSTMTLDVKTVFDNWFSGSSQYGGLSTLRLPLTIQGTPRGSVNVTLKNAQGSSNTQSFSLP